MLQRAIEADNVLPGLPQGCRLQRESSPPLGPVQPVLQGSAVHSSLLLASAVPHLLLTGCGCVCILTPFQIIDSRDGQVYLWLGLCSLSSGPASSLKVAVLQKITQDETQCDGKVIQKDKTLRFGNTFFKVHFHAIPESS